MAMPGQASGDFVEGSSALRILYVGHRNSFSATLTTDGFTQLNPSKVATDVSATLPEAPKRGVLGGSVCFSRPDAGNGMVGGPPATALLGVRPLGIFINDAAGNAYENSPAAASGQCPYVSGQGTYGTRLYETEDLAGGGALTWASGDLVYASKNGFLTNLANDANCYETVAVHTTRTVLGIVRIAPDSVHAELVLDTRI